MCRHIRAGDRFRQQWLREQPGQSRPTERVATDGNAGRPDAMEETKDERDVEPHNRLGVSRTSRSPPDMSPKCSGLGEAMPWGPFMIVEMDNGVSLDYHDFDDLNGEILPQHYAFLVTEDEFNEIFGRIEARHQDYWADPGLTNRGEINHHDGGRGVYFQGPDGHLLEIITRPYGSG